MFEDIIGNKEKETKKEDHILKAVDEVYKMLLPILRNVSPIPIMDEIVEDLNV